MLKEDITTLFLHRKKFASRKTLSESASKVLSCFEEFPEIRLNSKKICEETSLPKRTVINALNKLLQLGLIQRYGQGAGIRYQITF